MSDTTLLRKPLLKIGETYCAPQGTLKVTPNRAHRWVDKFQEMKNDNFSFPVPWGHKLSAMPFREDVNDQEWQEAVERRQQEEARWNATYVDDLKIEKEKDGEFLVAYMSAPPGWEVCPTRDALINQRDGTMVKEVSAAFGNWRDNHSQLHKDILVHVALCTRPIAYGAGGFKKADQQMRTLSSGPNSVEYSFTLSSGGGLAMPKNKLDDDMDDLDAGPKDAKPKDSKPKDAMPAGNSDEDIPYKPDDEMDDLDEPAPVDGGDKGLSPEPVEKPLDPEPAPIDPTPASTPMVGPNHNRTKELVGLLNTAGLTLPGDTDSSNFEERLWVLMHMIINQGGRFEMPDSGSQDAAAKPPATGTSGDNAPPAAEPPPVMMSNITDPRLKRSLERDQKRMRKEVSTICSTLKELGCPVYLCDREEAGASLIQLSFTPSGDIKLPARLRGLRLVQEFIQAMRGGGRRSQDPSIKTLSNQPASGAKPQANPLAIAGTRSKPGADPEVVAAMRVGAGSETGASYSKN